MLLDQKNKVTEIIVSGKGVIPYEQIERIDSLSIKPEDGIFFSKDEFISTLKGKNNEKMNLMKMQKNCLFY